jgi:hypothetical protein
MSVSSIGGPAAYVTSQAATSRVQPPASNDGDGDADSGKESAVSQAKEAQPSLAPQPGAPGQKLNVLA